MDTSTSKQLFGFEEYVRLSHELNNPHLAPESGKPIMFMWIDTLPDGHGLMFANGSKDIWCVYIVTPCSALAKSAFAELEPFSIDSCTSSARLPTQDITTPEGEEIKIDTRAFKGFLADNSECVFVFRASTDQHLVHWLRSFADQNEIDSIILEYIRLFNEIDHGQGAKLSLEMIESIKGKAGDFCDANEAALLFSYLASTTISDNRQTNYAIATPVLRIMIVYKALEEPRSSEDKHYGRWRFRYNQAAGPFYHFSRYIENTLEQIEERYTANVGGTVLKKNPYRQSK